MKKNTEPNPSSVENYKFIVSGGGTGGHIFPAISIANALKIRFPSSEILFVGAEGRMEMQRVPQAGYVIEGLPVSGFDRKNVLKNVKVVFNLLKSLKKARTIIKKFKPNLVVGVGGYASGPTLWAASSARIPTIIQEQNSYAGVTNKLLARKANYICVAYDEMENYFPKGKIIKTGNPVRQDLFNIKPKSAEAYSFFNLKPDKKTMLIIGGSLGARTINQCIASNIEALLNANIQVIWQTGKIYFEKAKEAALPFETPNLVVTDFVSRMDYAYSIADVVISRAGASTISELCLLAKPVILVPSPNVAEDHQTKNANALLKNNAAIVVADIHAKIQLIPTVLELLSDEKKLKSLSKNIENMADNNSSERIVKVIEKLLAKS